MKIIKGIYRHKEIPFAGSNTRPLTQSTRKSLFDTIENIIDLKDMVIYDICAGSGSFGIEALSREAKYVYFIEKHTKTVKDLHSTMRSIGISSQNYSIVYQDIMQCPALSMPADLIFIDPPFGHMMVEKILNKINNKHIHDTNPIIVIRSEYDFSFDGLHIITHKKMKHGNIVIANLHQDTNLI